MNEREIFAIAMQKPTADQRSAWLDSACGQDADLRSRIEALLLEQENMGSFLERPPADFGATLDRPPTERPGTVIGPYKLLEQIGEGGMGTVHMAEQSHPVHRKVALKVIKAGMDSGQVIARFEAERQALALMDHPNIAKVLDAGTTDAGRPYFVMELVKGVPITQYCDENHLPPRARLELFTQVCHAVQHAHQKGIIHRDLKPTNVLVTLYDDKPVPKVIDFGVAKATGGRLTERTMFTGYGQIVGTLEYMSPEQARLNALDIDTRGDIYSLGVLLYELLTGTTPFDKKRLREAAFDEMLRMIREDEPPKPSTRLSSAEGRASIAANRGMEPNKLSGLVRGELDWIVMKALEKDRNRRYETASGFAADVQHYLNDEAVVACPPSAVYRFRKFARRNKVALASGSAVALAVLTALVVLAVSNVRISHETREKETALDRAETNFEEAKKQEMLARQHAQRAEKQTSIAQVNEKAAKAQELLARRRYYAAQMNLAMQAWRAGEKPRVLELLEGQRPGPKEEDLRGFEWYYLWRLCHGGRRVPIKGHTVGVMSLAFSPDGTTLASSSRDATTRLWDTATGKEKGVLRGHDDGVWWVAFSPDGKTLATSDRFTSMNVWDMNTCKRLLRISQPVGGLAFSPGSKQLAGVLASNSSFHATIWDVATGEERLRLDTAGSVVGYLPDGKSLITLSNQYGQNSEVVCWDLDHAQPRYRIATPSIVVASLSPDGTRIVVATSAGTLIYDSATGEQTEAISGQSGIRGLALSPDNKLLACSKENKIVSVVSLETGKTLVEEVHLDSVWAVTFSPNGKLLATASLGGAIKLWDMTPAEEATTIPARGINTLQFSPDGKTLFVGNSGPTKIIDVAAGKEISHLPTSGVTSISADASALARSVGDGQANVWELRSGREIAKLPLRATGRAGLTLSPDGKQAATFSPWRNDNTVQLWDLNTQQARKFKTELGPNSVHCAEFSPNGKLLAAGFQFQMFTVWDMASGEIKLEVVQDPFMMNVFSIAFSLDNLTLAVGTDLGAVTLWDIHSGENLAACKGHTLPVRSMAFAPDGKTLATASDDKTVKLWDTITGQELNTIVGHQGAVHKIQFSPDGSTLATASQDGTVKLWRAATDLEARARHSPSLWAGSGTAVSTNFAQWSESLTGFSEAIELDPKQARAWTGRGWAHMKLNQLDKALADHSQAIELDPEQALYWNNRSVTYLKLNKPDDALADCAKAIELDPKFAPPWFNRGEAYRLLGQPEKAADAYLTALRLKTLPKPDIPVAHRNLASVLDELEKHHPKKENLRRFRAEATELLRIEGKTE